MTAKRHAFLLCNLVLLGASCAFARSNAAIKAFNQGVKAFNARQFNEAIPAFDDAISSDPDFVEAYYARGACKYYLKSMDAALMDLNDTLRLKPDYVDARALRGALNYETDRWDDALEDFNAVLTKKPNDAQSLLGRAVILLKREELKGAARDFKAFLRIRPDDPLAPKVRQLLASLKSAGSAEPPAREAESASRTAPPASHAVHRPAAREKALTHEDLQRLADSLMGHSMTESYSRKVLRGERAEAVGDIHSATGDSNSSRPADEAPQIVDPQ
jgi:tetratricopeptide (TPR) repeat protein